MRNYPNKLFAKKVVLTASQVQSLNSSPVVLLPSAGSNKVINVAHATLFYDYSTAAFGGIAVGEDLSFTYVSGATIAVCETTGFLDQTNDESRVVYPNNGTVATMSIDGAASSANQGVQLALLSGDVTGGGTSTLTVVIHYTISNID